MMAKDFKYEPLREGCVRLLWINTGFPQHISLDYGVFVLGKAPNFTALSYAWNGEERTQPIELQGKSLLITKNLESFLREAKRRIELYEDELVKRDWNRGWLWIDAICINQSDTKEKSRQVAMMKDIYESAQTIISWLGKMDEDSKLGMEHILEFDVFREKGSPSKPQNFSQDVMPFDEWQVERARGLRSIQHFISRGYWRRIWIFQEATTQRSHIIPWYGVMAIPTTLRLSLRQLNS